MLKINSLEINHVSKCFGDVLVLDDISFAVERSKIVGLACPSGGGKSTLLRCIQKLETIDSGTITVKVATSKYFDIMFHGKILNGEYRMFKLSKTTREDRWLMVRKK